MLLFNTLVIPASIFAGLVAASPAPSLPGLLVARQSVSLPLDDVPDKCMSTCKPMVSTLEACGPNLNCICPVDLNPCFDCIIAADSSKKEFSDTTKKTQDEACKSSGISTPSSSNGSLHLTAKSSAGIMLTFGVAAFAVLK
ncbi:hypothetical protein DL96DRAFT_1810819 [Flagelloscypha sp. PMI_526]|nr:hypothetical protein DL96DRAFT_1810819 [Flagelloscypha sp. PMI_526]